MREHPAGGGGAEGEEKELGRETAPSPGRNLYLVNSSRNSVILSSPPSVSPK